MKLRLAIGLGGLHLSLMSALVLSGFSTPVWAQGTAGTTAIGKATTCPTGYHRGKPGHTRGVGSYATGENDPKFCYPEVSNPPAVYVRASRTATCAAGYRVDSRSADFCTTAAAPRTWSAEDNLAKQTRLTKPSLDARCPTGWASAKDLKTCYTILDNPPASRLKAGKACAAGEMEEWGLWCTGSIASVTYAHADGHATKDFNEVYLYRQANGGDWQSMKCCLSPAAAAYYKSVGAGPKPVAASADGPGDYTSAADDEARGMAAMRGMGLPTGSNTPAQTCDTASSAGAAVGAAIGGETGARIGSMLGGFGKKKKKTAC